MSNNTEDMSQSRTQSETESTKQVSIIYNYVKFQQTSRAGLF